jgi:hypothetical protein
MILVWPNINLGVHMETSGTEMSPGQTLLMRTAKTLIKDNRSRTACNTLEAKSEINIRKNKIPE